MNNITRFAARCYFPHRDVWQEEGQHLGRLPEMLYSMLVPVGVSVGAFMGLFRIEMRA